LVHLAAGNVTVVSTDHVSWSEDRKTDPNMLKNASGIPGLEALYGLLLKGLRQRVGGAGRRKRHDDLDILRGIAGGVIRAAWRGRAGRAAPHQRKKRYEKYS
jgi:hypothetical protein